MREYSLGFQYEFARSWVLDLGYVGSSGINLTDYNHNHNQAQIVTPGDSIDQLYHLCTPSSDVVVRQGGPSGVICNTSGNAAYRVPHVGYEPIGLQASDFDGYSNFNSLQATVRHQFSHGLSFQAAYTWDRNLSTIFYANSSDINNALDVKSQYGRVSYDRPQRFVVNYSYDLPFGKMTEGIAGKLISGWNVSGVTIAQSGDALTFIDPGAGPPAVPSSGAGSAYGTSTALSFQGVGTAQFCAGMGASDIKNPGGTKANVNHYFNTAAFDTYDCKPAPVPFGDGTALDYGNSVVGIVLGPGQFNWDISILKNTQITERVKMQFRSDFYNAFNHPQFADPGGGGFGSVGFENIASPTYGQITHTSVNPRLIQFGLRFTF